jgi:hypothetical protein
MVKRGWHKLAGVTADLRDRGRSELMRGRLVGSLERVWEAKSRTNAIARYPRCN